MTGLSSYSASSLTDATLELSETLVLQSQLWLLLSVGLQDLSLCEFPFPLQLCKLSGAGPVFNSSRARSTIAWSFNFRWIWEMTV